MTIWYKSYSSELKQFVLKRCFMPVIYLFDGGKVLSLGSWKGFELRGVAPSVSWL